MSKSGARKAARRESARLRARGPKRGVAATATKRDGEQDLIEMAEAIQVLKTSRPTFYRWLRSGKVKGMKVGRQWRFYRKDIERFLEGEPPRVDLPLSPAPLIATLRKGIAEAGWRAPALESLAPIDEAVRLMALLGVALGASDMHVTTHAEAEAPEPVSVLRYRIDGTLHGFGRIDRRLTPAIARQWKQMAACNVDEHVKSQDGRVMARLSWLGYAGEDRVIDMRVNFTPALLGEMVTVRILDKREVKLDVDAIGYSPRDRERLLRAIASPAGVIVVTGPVGTGKTTTIYSCLSRLAGPEMKIVTVEDPVEFNLPWVSQVQMNQDAGVTHETAMRSFLRSAPNVIFVGEVRNAETAWLVCQAALTGHLVFTTLHADDAPRGLIRLVEIGVNPFVVADSTRLVASQRLVRKLCARCSKEEMPEASRMERAAELAGKGGVELRPDALGFRSPVGCDECHGIGFKGRTVIAEMLEVTPEIGRALRKGDAADELRTIAVGQGMSTMVADGIRRAAAGETTLDEVMRAVGYGSL